WGKLISIEGTLKDTVGVKNPYRYRGYRYDTETGLYYLQSRYYNPEWGRFINADALGGSVGELLGHNIFAYTKNNPINMSDKNGFRPIYTVGEETDEMREASLASMFPPVDITDKLNKTLQVNAKQAIEYSNSHSEFKTNLYWIKQVKSNGPWDLKRKSEWKYPNMTYNGKKVNGADIGNLHYGYVGMAAGFDETILKIAAGLYQIRSGTSNKEWQNNMWYGDDPRDQAWIMHGILKYCIDNEASVKFYNIPIFK
uniref:RHS repeat-associated core domain-containing protein n=1 Tax=Clostridium sp. UBA4548 TaxID=1946361 RepID=UPI0025C57E2B